MMPLNHATSRPPEEQQVVEAISHAILAEVRNLPFSRWLDMPDAVAEASRTVRAKLEAAR